MSSPPATDYGEQIKVLYAAGHTDAEIADALGLTIDQVRGRRYRQGLRRKNPLTGTKVAKRIAVDRAAIKKEKEAERRRRNADYRKELCRTPMDFAVVWLRHHGYDVTQRPDHRFRVNGRVLSPRELVIKANELGANIFYPDVNPHPAVYSSDPAMGAWPFDNPVLEALFKK